MVKQTEREQLNRAFHALSDPTRRDILARCSNQMRSVGSLAAEYAVSQPAVTKHIKVLEQAGLVQKLRNRQTVYVMTSPVLCDAIVNTTRTVLTAEYQTSNGSTA